MSTSQAVGMRNSGAHDTKPVVALESRVNMAANGLTVTQGNE